jgi:hypothetical protein
MVSRALSLATVTLLIGCFAGTPAWAQAQNLEAGKSPSQIFAGTCNACHKSPRGLLKTVPAGSLTSFLRQHYTTSGEMASLLAAFLVSNGAADTRYIGAQPKSAKDAKSDSGPSAAPDHIDRFGRRLRPAAPPQEAAKPDVAEPREAAKPEADGLSPQGGRNAKRLARPAEPPDAAKPAADGQAPAQAGLEAGPDGRKPAGKKRLSKRGRPGSEEPPKSDAAKSDAAKSDAAKSDAAKSDAAKSDAAKSDAAKSDAAKMEPAKVDDDKPKSEAPQDEAGKPDATKPSGDGKSESVRIEPPKESGSDSAPVLRADPVPSVTPAPPASSAPSDSPSVSAAVSSGTPEAGPGPSAAPAQPSASPAMTASVPPPPVAPAGPPAPPISQ